MDEPHDVAPVPVKGMLFEHARDLYTTPSRNIEFWTGRKWLPWIEWKWGPPDWFLPLHHYRVKPANKEKVLYLNIYEDSVHHHDSSTVAEEWATPGRKACVRIEYEDGQLDG